MNAFLIKRIGIISLVGALAFSGVGAADTDTVTATVTVQSISVAANYDGAVAYGTLGQDSDKSTITTDLNDTQDVVNDGNITEQINIRGTDSANWTLTLATGSQDRYKHAFCTASCGSPPANFTTLSSVSYSTLTASLASAASQSFDLRLSTPTTSSVFTQQSVNVTVQAVAI